MNSNLINEISQQYQQLAKNCHLLPSALPDTLSQSVFSLLAEYLELLQSWTKKIDLIAPASNETVIDKHLIDCLAAMLLTAEFAGEEICQHGLVDVGSGAGLPGIIAAISRKFSHVTLIEPRQNRVGFLKEVRRKLKLENLEIAQMQIQEFAQSADKKFGLLTSRALGETELLLSIAKQLLVPEGLLAEMQGGDQQPLPGYKAVLDYKLPQSKAGRKVTIFVTNELESLK